MAGDRYELDVVTRFDEQGISAFVASVKSALSEITEAAKRAADSGGSLRGFSEDYQGIQQRAYGTVQRGQTAGALSATSAESLLKELNSAFKPAFDAIRAVSPNFKALEGVKLLQQASTYASDAALPPVELTGRQRNKAAATVRRDASPQLGEGGDEEDAVEWRRRYLQASQNIKPDAMTADEIAKVRKGIENRSEAVQVNRAFAGEEDLAVARRGAQNQYGEAETAAQTAGFRNQQAANDARARANDDAYNESVANRVAEMNRAAAAEAEAFAGSSLYLSSTERLATARAELAARESEALATNDKYLKATAEAAAARNEQRAAESRARTNPRNAQAAADASLSQERELRAAESARLAGVTPGDIRGRAGNQLEQERQRVAQALVVEAARTDADNIATAELAQAKRATALATKRAQLGQGPLVTPELQAGAADNAYQAGALRAEQAFDNAQQKLAEVARSSELVSESGRSYAEVLGEARAAVAREAAAINVQKARALSGDTGYISDTAETNALATATRERVRLAELGITDIDATNQAERRAAIAVAEQANANRQRLAEIERMRTSEGEEASLLLERKATERAYNRELNARMQEEIKARGAAGDPAYQGTWYQRYQQSRAAAQGGTPQLPGEFQTLGSQIGSRIATTAQFAVAGLGIFQAVSTIKEMIDSAEKLQQSMTHLRESMVATDQAGDFPTMKAGLLDIAKDTGTDADQVVDMAVRIRGAFHDTNETLLETKAALVLQKTSGLDPSEVSNYAIAISKSFSDLSSNDGTAVITKIQDEALHLQDVFGASQKEIIAGVATMAPVAQEVGLTFQQTAALIAASAQASGRPVQSVAEGLSRVLPNFQKNAQDIIRLYQSTPALAPNLGVVTNAINQGNFGQVILQLGRDWNTLTKAQQDYIVTSQGGRREAQALLAVFQDSGDFIAAADDKTSHAGRTAKEYAAFQETLRQQIARLTETLKLLGTELLRAGVGEALGDAGAVAAALLKILTLVLHVVGDINSASHGFVVTLGEAYAALKLIQAASTAIGVGKLVGAGGAAAAAEGGGGSGGGLLAALGLGSLLRRIRGKGGGGGGGGGFEDDNPLAPGAEGIGTGVAAGEATGGGFSLAGVGAGLTALGPAAVALTSVYAGINYVKQRGQVQSAAESARQRLMASDDAYLQQLAKQHSDAVTGFGNWFFGANQPDEMARKILNQRANKPVADQAAAINARSGSGQDQIMRLNQKERDDLLDWAKKEDARRVKAGTEIQDDNTVERIVAPIQSDSLGPKRFQSLIDKANKGDKDSAAVLAQIINIYKQRPGGATQIEGAMTVQAQKLAQAQSDQRVTSGDSLKNAQAALQAYQSGQASLSETVTTLNGEIAAYQSMANRDPTQEGALQGLLLGRGKVISDALRSGIDMQSSLGDQGDVAGSDAKISALTRYLKDPRVTDHADRLKAAQDIISAEKERLTRLANDAGTESQKLSILENGFELPPEVKAVLAQSLTEQSPAYSDFLAKYVDPLGAYSDTVKAKALGLVASGKAGGDALVAAQKAERDVLQAQLDSLMAVFDATGAETGPAAQRLAAAVAPVQAAIDALTAGINAAQGDPNLNTDVPGVNQKTGGTASGKADADIIKKRADAQRDLARAQANGDPVALAEADLAGAKAEYADALLAANGDVKDPAVIAAQAKQVSAQNALDKANQDINSAKIDQLKQQYADDPVKLAQLSQQQADAAAKNAHGEVEKINAAIARAQADRSFEDAMAAVAKAKSELLQSQMTERGDPIGAADEKVKQDQRELAAYGERLRNAGIDPASNAAYINMQNQLVQDQTSATQTTISESERRIDNDLQLKRISVGQAVQRLRALEAVATSKDDIDAIEIKIQQLLQSAGQNLAFNIPSTIKLPTLYEVRRFQETPQGQGYNDNRNVNVVMHVNNGMDQAAAGRWLSDVMGTPPRVATTNRRV